MAVTKKHTSAAQGVEYMITRTNNTEISYANQAFARATGYTLEEVIGSSFLRYSDLTTPKIIGEDIRATVLGGQRWEGVLAVKCRDGSTFWSTTSISPWYENGKLTGSTAVRTMASEHEINKTKKLYKRITTHPKIFGIRAGKLVFRGIAAGLNLFLWRRVSVAIALCIAIPCATTLLFTYFFSESTAQISFNKLLLISSIVSIVSVGAVLALAYQTWFLPLRKSINELHLISSGELEGQNEHKAAGDLGLLENALTLMRKSLISMIEEIRSGISSMSIASGELSMGNLDLSRRTESQAASTAEITSGLGELIHMVAETANIARNAEKCASEAQNISEEGIQAVSAAVKCMAEIVESSRQMNSVVSTIESIAAQTNLLALNAAVEAARAGQHGRGFAVVAKEVRLLATRSVEATENIKDLIKNSMQRTNAGQVKVSAAASAIDQLSKAISTVDTMMVKVASGTKEQNTALDKIHHALEDIDQTTQQNAALVEQIYASTEMLTSQSKSLSTTVSVFRC
ncbi:methyl-accepting chemotaxis protein [Herbaspirillum lusitanum]|uniref:methyl-accepting chemotaxis protein n=1 Tax=Herbaspirillum lusitanum TaxID=213312 RepID=UPI00058DE781|nr:methyl-accepting chemotaxis protein [Herbaspirillum lusitanum]